MLGVHGEKLVSAKESNKLPPSDIPIIEGAINRYYNWIKDLKSIDEENLDIRIEKMVDLLNEYKFKLDVDTIFDSPNDFLYRQKGQLKIDNTVMEEFLPIFIYKCFKEQIDKMNVQISSQTKTFSSLYFTASIENPLIGGGMKIKSKDQDFSICRKL